LKLNGQPAHAPFSAGEVQVTLETPTTLQILWDQQGVSLICDTKTDICRFQVLGWHHGQVSGLLGSNDGEIVNDIITPDGEVSVLHSNNEYK
jgi:hypothetical protein